MEIKDIIEENYNIKVNEIVKSEESTDGNVYIIFSDDKKYVLKIYSDIKHTNSMISLHSFFEENEINVPKIIKCEENSFVESEGKYYVLYSFMNGEQLYLGNTNDNTIIEKIAVELRKFHNACSGENKFELKLVPFDEAIGRKSVVHFDITNHNIFIDDGNIGFIDFDDAKYGEAVCDVAIAVGNLFFSKTRGVNLEGVKRFIDAYYGSDKKLKEKESKFIKQYAIKWIDYILDNSQFDTSTLESFEVKKKLIEKNLFKEEVIEEKKMEHKTKYIVSIVLLTVTVITLIVTIIALVINYNKITGDMNLAKNAIISKDSVVLKVNRDEIILGKGERVSILKDDIINNEYLIKYGENVGRIEKNDVSYFLLNENEREPLMLDVSQFNIVGKESEDNPNRNFKSEKDFELFIINNNIQYVYIRLGGRGWGQKGVLYYDDEAPRYIESCEYLGVPYGFYFLDEALNDEEVMEEVKFVKEFLDKNKTKMNILPLAIDLEYQSGKGRADDIWEQRTPILNKLISELDKIGEKSIIYSNGARIEKYIKDVNTNFWVAMYPQDDVIPYDSYSSVVKIDQLQEELNQMSNANIIDKLLNKGGTDVKKYSDEFLNKVLGWQFTESGASKDGIDDYIDLSVMNNKMFKYYIEK